MAEAVWKENNPKSLYIAQRLAMAEEEYLRIDVATLAIIEDKLPISKNIMMKKKR